MSANPTNGNGRRHYRSGPPVQDRVAAYAAPRLGLEASTVGQLIRGRAAVNVRCAEIIRAFRALGDEKRLVRFMSPILAAYEQREAPPFCAATFRLAQEADSREEVAETAYLSDPTDANLDRWIRALEEQQQRGDALLMSAYAERMRRRGLA